MQENDILDRVRLTIRRVLCSLGSGLNREDREEIEQEALLEFYIKVQEMVAKGSAEPGREIDHAGLAVVIARCRTIDARRRLGHPVRGAVTGLMGPQTDDEAPSLEEALSESVGRAAAETPEKALLHRERERYLLDKLNAKERTILALVQLGYTDREISEQQSLPLMKVKANIQDIKRKCRRILQAYDGLDG